MNRSDIKGHMNWRHELLALEEENRRAFLDRDLDRLATLWSNELLVNSPINRVHNKQQVLDLLRAGTIAHFSMEAEIEAIERRRDLVIIMGSEQIINEPGAPVLQRRFTHLWSLEDGLWRLLLRHANLIPEPRQGAA